MFAACKDDEWLGVALAIATAGDDKRFRIDLGVAPEVRRQGDQIWRVVARRSETGEIAGETDVTWNPEQPTHVGQGTTAVRLEHRGHALGKWMKAVMLQRILNERPTVNAIVTANADSNDAMLGINRVLGFEPYLANTTWQADISDVRAALHTRLRVRDR